MFTFRVVALREGVRGGGGGEMFVRAGRGEGG